MPVADRSSNTAGERRSDCWDSSTARTGASGAAPTRTSATAGGACVSSSASGARRSPTSARADAVTRGVLAHGHGAATRADHWNAARLRGPARLAVHPAAAGVLLTAASTRLATRSGAGTTGSSARSARSSIRPARTTVRATAACAGCCVSSRLAAATGTDADDDGERDQRGAIASVHDATPISRCVTEAETFPQNRGAGSPASSPTDSNSGTNSGVYTGRRVRCRRALEISGRVRRVHQFLEVPRQTCPKTPGQP